ncbi:methyltransferase, FkbM family [Clostridium sp. ASBs410]|nr:methyltransferase, FkbM family [Clostridium sp. ASBs410]
MKPTIRLSQCMIVKNEEKNIRRALSWGKGIVCEQIVVDTGSSDHTVQIAEEMGAKVFHFPWGNDFSAAKNFALEQANGDWIAFLDADEYFSEEDARKILPLLKNSMKQFSPIDRPQIVRTMIANLNNSGNVFSTAMQSRIFRNNPSLRYVNRIHEQLSLAGEGKVVTLDATDLLTIYHTGYSATAYEETGKIGRNRSLLEEEVEREPENYNAWSYLGDTLLVEKKLKESEAAYNRVMEHMGESVMEDRKDATFCNLLKIKYMTHWEGEKEILSIYQKAKDYSCTSPDLEYWMGLWYYQQGEEEKGRSYLELALSNLDKNRLLSNLTIAGDLSNVYQKLFISYKKMGRPSEMIRYGVLVLRVDPYQETVLKDILLLLKKEAGEENTADATFGFLSKLYDLSSSKGRFFLLKASKLSYFSALEERIYGLLSSEERELLNQNQSPPYSASEEVSKEDFSGFECRNELDREYLAFIKEVNSKELSELMVRFQSRLLDLNKTYGGVVDVYAENFSRFHLWGEIKPKENNYEPLEKRIVCIKNNWENFLWLYQKLSDYQSKKVLMAILKNWVFLDTESLSRVKKGQDDYYDLDLIAEGRGKIFVDIGAYYGSASLEYIKTYGKQYKEIICYEPNEHAVRSLEENVKEFEHIQIRSVALASVDKEKFLCTSGDDPVMTHISSNRGTIPVRTKTLDSDVTVAIDIMNIDVNGYEDQVLAGAENHLKNDHPNLIIALYHGFEDLVRIPRMIADMNPDYKFYLRYYGGDLIPTNFVLYAI